MVDKLLIWLVNCSCSGHKLLIGNHLDALSKYLCLYSSKYLKAITLGDFNADIEENHMKYFCDNCIFKRLIKQQTC